MLPIKDDITSPNFDDRPTAIPDTIVIHYTGMATGKAALDRLTDPKSKVSAHYLMFEDGNCFQLVDPLNRAWHAGQSYWRGRGQLNDFAIGIELVNKGHEHGYHPFPEAQMDSLIKLLKQLIDRYQISPINIVGHSDIAPTRKKDPGELFDWRLLAGEGIGIYPDPIARPCPVESNIRLIQSKLLEFGYKIELTGIMDELSIDVITAFKRRFYQHDLNMGWNSECTSILDNLLELQKAYT